MPLCNEFRIKVKNVDSITVADVPIGTFFEYDKNIFLKISHKDWNAVWISISRGEYCNITNNVKVTPFSKATLELER